LQYTLIKIGIPIVVVVIIAVLISGASSTCTETGDCFTGEITQDCSGDARCFIGLVTRVIDGDTIEVDEQTIRFSLASAPEMNEFGGVESRDFVEEICPVGSTALIDEDDGQTEGSYGRIIGVIYCNDMNLNEELLDSGLGYLSSGFCNKSEFSSTLWAQKHGC